MAAPSVPTGSAPLSGAEIHGFQTVADLDIPRLFAEASSRWFRPNEVHAMLSNPNLLRIEPQPIDHPRSGTVLCFDRKVVRNFRKDGHNWKKKKDGKAIQEAHEKLKIGNEERVHVYYARCEDDFNFYRRCYWLLEKNSDRTVLVHYRQTSEDYVFPLPLIVVDHIDDGPLPLHQGSSCTLADSHYDKGSAVMSEETNSASHKREFNYDEINTLDWDMLLETTMGTDSTCTQEGGAFTCNQQIRNEFCDPLDVLTNKDVLCNTVVPYHDAAMGTDYSFHSSGSMSNSSAFGISNNNSHHESGSEVLMSPNHDSVSVGNDDMPTHSLVDHLYHASTTDHVQKFDGATSMQPSLTSVPLINIVDMSPGWSYTTEETKVIIIGSFHGEHSNLTTSNIYCVFDDKCVPAKMIRMGVFRCFAPKHAPGSVDLFLTLDGQTPVSQVLSFNYRSGIPLSNSEFGTSNCLDVKLSQKEFQKMQIRLAKLLFSSRKASILLNQRSSKFLKEAAKFASVTSSWLEKEWIGLLDNCNASNLPTTEGLLEVVLRNKLQEWLLENVAEGRRITGYDDHGQGVIHLCAILDYVWAVRLFSLTGISLDYRDAHGWTALHWAAYYGRFSMVAVLLSAGANPSLVADPTPEFPGGRTASDIAANQGHEGLAAYLGLTGITAHRDAMKSQGYIQSDTLPLLGRTKHQYSTSHHLSEQEICLDEALTASRIAAVAASEIQSVFRDRLLKLQTQEIQSSHSAFDAFEMVSALKIQHAYRNYRNRKTMRAAARIQTHFRTWRTRQNFLSMRRQVIKIQAMYRGHQVRRQYRNILWSVGVLEKAILRWRLKRKGLRGIQVDISESMIVGAEGAVIGEEFFKVSLEQAGERYQRAAVRVQALFRSYKAQQEYRKMKLFHEQAKLEFNELSKQM